MSSENPSGADNQQETSLATLDPGWIVGFTDGEGCFSVSLQRNDLAWHGWQIQPTFQVSQHTDHRPVLIGLKEFFGCGRVRSKGPKSDVEVFSVYSTIQLLERVIPFFEENELRVKRDDFEKFSHIVRGIRARSHRSAEEFERLVTIAYSMNSRGKQRKRPIEEILLGSSETVREALLKDRQRRYSPILMATWGARQK